MNGADELENAVAEGMRNKEQLQQLKQKFGVTRARMRTLESSLVKPSGYGARRGRRQKPRGGESQSVWMTLASLAQHHRLAVVPSATGYCSRRQRGRQRHGHGQTHQSQAWAPAERWWSAGGCRFRYRRWWRAGRAFHAFGRPVIGQPRLLGSFQSPLSPSRLTRLAPPSLPHASLASSAGCSATESPGRPLAGGKDLAPAASKGRRAAVRPHGVQRSGGTATPGQFHLHGVGFPWESRAGLAQRGLRT